MHRSVGAFLLVGLASCTLLTNLDGYAGTDGAATDGGAQPDAGPAPPPPPDGGTPADAGTPYRDAVLEDRPIAYWPMDDATGSLVAKDVVGNHDATLSGAATFGVPGVAGTAFAIPKEGPHLDVANPIELLGENPYTLEVWAIPTYTATYQNILDHRSGSNGYVLYFRDTGGVQLEQLWQGGTRGGWFDRPKSTAFQHVVATFDGTTFRLYVDGVQSTTTYQGTGGPTSFAGGLAMANAYEGVLDEIAVYDHALPPERVTLHHKLGSGP